MGCMRDGSLNPVRHAGAMRISFAAIYRYWGRLRTALGRGDGLCDEEIGADGWGAALGCGMQGLVRIHLRKARI